MPTVIDGSTGVSQVQDGSIQTADLANGSVAAGKLSGVQSGAAPLYGARAWCVFDGTLAGTNPPLAGGNVTSVTRNGVGDYTINFTSAMPDTNYGITGTARAATTNGITVVPKVGGTLTAAAAQIVTDRNTSGVLDSNLVSVAIFR